MQRIGDSLKDKRVLITQSNDFMGPALCKAFCFYGAEVKSDPRPLLSQSIVNDVVQKANDPDIVILNLVYPILNISTLNVDALEWKSCFAHMVEPLPKISKLILPRMIEKKQGKIVVMGSATALDGRIGGPAYNAARGAQLSWVKKVGNEMAKHNIQINLIAQAFVDNPTFYANGVGSELELVPAGRLADSEECSALAIFLSCSESNFFNGQCFPIAGGLIQ